MVISDMYKYHTYATLQPVCLTSKCRRQKNIYCTSSSLFLESQVTHLGKFINTNPCISSNQADIWVSFSNTYVA